MKFDPLYMEKTDSLLQDVLKTANGDEIIHVIMVLAPKVENEDIGTEELDPAQFASRQDYRQKMIMRQQEQLNEEIGETLQALQSLSLKLNNKTIGRAVVVEGTTYNILKALEIPGVYRASLNRPIVEELFSK